VSLSGTGSHDVIYPGLPAGPPGSWAITFTGEPPREGRVRLR
jgi:hypothetical protein